MIPSQIITGKILFLGAHPDDIEIGCGGTAAKCVERGHSIAFAIASRENNHETAQKRETEAKKAAKLLGLSEKAGNLFFGNLPDTQLDQKHTELREWLKKVSKRFNPNTVFTHRHDLHTDHQAIYKVSIGVFQDKHLLLYKIPRPSPDEPFTPNHIEDISDFIKKKVALCKCHGSQDPIYISKDSVETNSHQCYIEGYGRNGLKPNGYAEVFFIHASRSPLDEPSSAAQVLNYDLRVIEQPDGTRRWED